MLRELETENTGLDELEAAPALEDEMAVRRALIRIQQLEKDAEHVKHTKAAVNEAYNQQLESIERQRKFLRDSIQGWCERFGKASFPDVGTAYLQTGKAKLEVEDRDALRAELGAMFTKEVFDETAAKNYALEQALESGVVTAGTKLVPGGPTLAIRKAAR